MTTFTTQDRQDVQRTPPPFNYKGTSLRDAFAGQAMNALIARTKYGFDTEALAKESYMVADAMMKAREL